MSGDILLCFYRNSPFFDPSLENVFYVYVLCWLLLVRVRILMVKTIRKLACEEFFPAKYA